MPLVSNLINEFSLYIGNTQMKGKPVFVQVTRYKVRYLLQENKLYEKELSALLGVCMDIDYCHVSG